MLKRKAVVSLSVAVALFALNAWIAHRLFATGFTALQSNESAFIAISRFFRDHWNDLRWFPWFDGGMPIENAYQPVLPGVTAILAGISGWPIGRAYHVVLALAYCFGPVTLFWFVLDWAESLALAAVAGILFSLVSPAAMLFPAVRHVSGGPWVAQRLFNLVYYGEDPHNVALALLPLALLFLRRVIVRRDAWSFAGAVFWCSAVVLSNVFGALTLALGAFCIVLALCRGWLIVAATGFTAWCLSAPWLPPALIAVIRANAFSGRGQFDGGFGASLALAFLLAWLAGTWWLTRRLNSSFERFVWLFAPWMCAFPAFYYAADVTLVPQSHRYQLELEMAVCLVAAVLWARVMRNGVVWRVSAGVLFAVLVIHQTVAYLHFAHKLIRPIEIRTTAEYDVARWLDGHLPGQRVMVSGDAAWVFNVFSDNPQMSGGHEPTAPNFIQQIAVYQMYSGMNAGARDAEVSLLWLKAFGNQAVVVPGTQSGEVYKPFARPDKFDGMLRVLWRGTGDTIYEVPQRSRSLAHVIPVTAVAERRPVNGLDLEPVRGYVAALDDTSLPDAELKWAGQSTATVRARVLSNQVVALQINYDPAWQARVNGLQRPVRKDGLGMMVVDTGCAGDCVVELNYGTTRQIWLWRFLSALAFLGMVLGIIASC